MILINSAQSEKLKANWGDKAESMACMAEVRVYDPLSFWECYIFAQNPEDENEIMCLIHTNKLSSPGVSKWTLQELCALYNQDGEGVEVDQEYRPRRTAELFKILNKEFR
jgi:hypothetical protein